MDIYQLPLKILKISRNKHTLSVIYDIFSERTNQILPLLKIRIKLEDQRCTRAWTKYSNFLETRKLKCFTAKLKKQSKI